MPSFFSEASKRVSSLFRGRAIDEVRQYSARELSEFLIDAVPELQESLTQADIELALDDRGWLGFNRSNPAELDPRTRRVVVERSRLYWARDPLAKQAVRLWTTYAFGNGLTYEAKDKEVQTKLDQFFKSRKNRMMLNSAGQQKNSNKLLIDGEVFFAMFATDPAYTLRTIDPLQIDKIISDPDDEETILCYRRTTPGNKTMYYVDWTVEEDEVADVEKAEDPETKRKVGKLEKDGDGELIRVYHQAFDPFGRRGNGLLSCCVDWSREHRRFMEARVGLTQALSKFAYKLTAKGGQGMINALQNKLQSSLVNTGISGSVEKNPPPAAGATWLQNGALDMTPMPRASGAGDAKEDGNSLKLMVCAGTGIMLHYFGDPSTGNLATATAMELPMLKMFSAYQELNRGVYRDLCSIALEEGADDEPAEIDIELPPILDEDLEKLGTFLVDLAGVFPEAKVPEVLRPALIAYGVENIDDVMDAIEEQKEENDEKAKEIAKQGPPAPGPGQPAVPQLTLSKESIDTMNHFADSLKEAMAP